MAKKEVADLIVDTPAAAGVERVYGIAGDGLTALWVGGIARAWWFVLLGILGVIVGIFTFVYPGITAVALLYLTAWDVVRVVFEIVTTIQLRKEINNEWDDENDSHKIHQNSDERETAMKRSVSCRQSPSPLITIQYIGIGDL